jgi:hypothetical protein
VASTDIVSLAVIAGLMIFIDVLGYKTRIGTMYIASIMLGVYTLGWIVKNSTITFSVVQNSGSTFFSTYSIDSNLWAVIFAVLVLVSFLLTYYEVGSAR